MPIFFFSNALLGERCEARRFEIRYTFLDGSNMPSGHTKPAMHHGPIQILPALLGGGATMPRCADLARACRPSPCMTLWVSLRGYSSSYHLILTSEKANNLRCPCRSSESTLSEEKPIDRPSNGSPCSPPKPPGERARAAQKWPRPLTGDVNVKAPIHRPETGEHSRRGRDRHSQTFSQTVGCGRRGLG